MLVRGHGSVAEEIKGSRNNARPPTLIKVSEEGAEFRSYIDGSRHTLTPESSIETQQKLGADLIVVFDECTAFHDSRDYTARSMELTHRWAKRCITAFERGQEAMGPDRRQALYGIVQGGAFRALREASAAAIAGMPFDGLAIGGNLGSTREEMHAVLDWTVPLLPPDKPRHLLGIGDVAGIFEAVARGVDTFDCVMPTRSARAGSLLLLPGSGTAAVPARECFAARGVALVGRRLHHVDVPGDEYRVAVTGSRTSTGTVLPMSGFPIR